MKLSGLLKPFSSFRIQLIAFIAVMVVITGIVISVINQRVERRTSVKNDEYTRAIIQATDLAYRSLSEGKYLYNLVNTGGSGLPVDSESIIRHIMIVDVDKKKILDCTDGDEVGQSYDSSGIPEFQPGNSLLSEGDLTSDMSRTVKFSIETTVALRDILIVYSLKPLQQVKEAAERDRLIAFIGLGLVLIITIAVVSKRFTGPITELGQAARNVTKGDLDFTVPVSGPEEVSALSQTFNEMLAGLRGKRDLEEQLQRAERSAVVGRVASGIAHEIRNPLNFINLSIDHLREAFAPKDEPMRATYTHILITIKDELARLNRLVGDFLSYGRPAKLKLREIDARSLIEEVRDLVNTKAEQQGVKVSIEQNGALDAKLYGDAEQIKTCFSNLMINAIQAMPDGGALNISLRPENSHLEIRFADTGSGIAPEAMEQIFEPYYSTKDTGIGLGLPLTKKIIEEHGGQINVESEPDRGTTFTVTLLCKPKTPY
ncbi:MAG: ATP-binding protein [Blastocatellales bacterium]